MPELVHDCFGYVVIVIDNLKFYVIPLPTCSWGRTIDHYLPMCEIPTGEAIAFTIYYYFTRLWRQRIQIISMSSTSHALFMYDKRTYSAFTKLCWILLIQAFSHLLSIFFMFCLSHVCVKVQNLSRIIELSFSWSS